MKYEVHRLDVRSIVDVEKDLQEFIDSLKGEIVSILLFIITHITLCYVQKPLMATS